MFRHTTTGRTFTTTGEGEFGGTSAAGTWDSGQAGTIFPGETFRDGSPVWVAATATTTGRCAPPAGSPSQRAPTTSPLTRLRMRRTYTRVT